MGIEKQDMSELKEGELQEKYYISMEEFLKKQKEFAKKFVDFDNLTPRGKMGWTKEFITCIHQELAELMEELPWKHWKKYDRFKYDELNIKYELIDIFHFFLDLCLIWGLDGKELAQKYYAKNKLNFERQKDKRYGYV